MKHFLTRSASSIVLLAILAYAVFCVNIVSTLIFGALMTIGVFLAVFEFASILKNAGHNVYVKTASFMIALIVPACILDYLFFDTITVLTMFLMATFPVILWIMILLFHSKPDNVTAVMNTAGTMLLFSIPVLCIVHIFLIYNPLIHNNDYIFKSVFLYFILVTKSGDIGGYVFGSLTNKFMKNGNHKMIPSVSPGKSWEGLAGGLACSIVLSYFLFPFLDITGSETFNIVCSIFMGILLYFGGLVGDLAESAFKRTFKVKDSGGKIPGIGGVLDLVDSILLNAVIFIIFLNVLNF